MPVLTPFELCADRTRLYKEIFRLGPQRREVTSLPITHEETVTFHARDFRVTSTTVGNALPFAIKEANDPRPKGGLLRLRDFIMKGATLRDAARRTRVSFGKTTSI